MYMIKSDMFLKTKVCNKWIIGSRGDAFLFSLRHFSRVKALPTSLQQAFPASSFYPEFNSVIFSNFFLFSEEPLDNSATCAFPHRVLPPTMVGGTAGAAALPENLAPRVFQSVLTG